MNDTAQDTSRYLGNGERIRQEQMLKELEALGPDWRLETPTELYSLVDYSGHTNQHGAMTRDESLKAGYHWTSQEYPGVPGARVVVGFYLGYVLYGFDYDRAFARAVRVSGQ